MEKGLLFFTISMICLWVILDEFFGTKKLSSIASSMTPNFSNQKTNKEIEQERKEVKKSVDENSGFKTDKQKKAVKEAIDKFYDEANFYRDGKFQDEA